MKIQYRQLACAFSCLFLSGQATASGGIVTDLKTFRDWSVTCNNVKSCMAYSVSSNSEGGIVSRPRGLSEETPPGWMAIERDAGPAALPIISLSLQTLKMKAAT